MVFISPRPDGQAELSLTPLELMPHLHVRHLRAVLLAPTSEILLLICPVCGSEMRLIAGVTEREPVQPSGACLCPFLMVLAR